MKLRHLLSPLLLLCAAGAWAQTQTLLVLSKADQTLSVIDPVSLKVLGKAPSGPDPHEVTVSADGRTAYISNYAGGGYNTITLVDLAAIKPLPTIDLGPLRGPHGLWTAAGKIWFTAEAAKAVGSIDPATNKVDWILGTGQDRTHMIYAFEDGKRMVTSNISSATMTIIDERAPGAGRGPGPGPGGPGGPGGRGPGGPGAPRKDWVETVVPVGPGAEGFDVAPGGAELWAANAGDGTISVIDLQAKKVSQTIQANVRSANRLKFTPNGKLAFVSMLSNAEIAIFDVAGRKEVKRLKINKGAAGIQMQPDGARAFVACTPEDSVVVVDLKTLEITGRLDAGKQPDGMAWAVRK
jgi:DNA-binding beta-propeller fold protein YncE